MSTYVVVAISPETTTSPVFTSVSQATRPYGSSRSTASRTPSEIWSATLSGWPSVTDSEVNRYSSSESGCVVMSRESLAAADRWAVHQRDAPFVAHAEHGVADPDRVEPRDAGRAGLPLTQQQRAAAVPRLLVVDLHPRALDREAGTALRAHEREVRDVRPARIAELEAVAVERAGTCPSSVLGSAPDGRASLR